MIQADQCPACGNPARSLRYAEGAYRLWLCQGCGLGYCDPQPDQAQLESTYTDAYAGATVGYFSKVARKLARSRGRVRHMVGYLDRPFDAPPRKRFLDVGCNGGFMVQAAIEQGFDAYGLDPDPVSIAYAQTHYPKGHFTHAFLENYEARVKVGPVIGPDDRFDAIYCSEVIEHAPDPNAFVRALARLAKPGAVLYLTTPDLGHFMVPRNLAKWDAYCPPDHCLYFSRASLGALLQRHGFKPLVFRLAIKPGIKILARRTSDLE